MKLEDLRDSVNQYYEDVKRQADANPHQPPSKVLADVFNNYLETAKSLEPDNKILENMQPVKAGKDTLSDLAVLAGQLKSVMPRRVPRISVS